MPRKNIIILSLLILIVGGYIGTTVFRFQNQSKATVIIFSPHPDDAVLCCAGYIQQSMQKGNTIHVINVTNGDGYKEAAAVPANTSVTSLTPSDMIALGKQRQEEERRAMNILGVDPSLVTFLGYPDGWLDEVYTNESSTPFTNPFTNTSHTIDTRRPFTKASVIVDIASRISAIRPTQIIVPVRADSALDHIVTNLFVSDAMRLASYSGTLIRYIIHTGKEATQTAQAPFTVTLTDEQLEKKKQAIEAYTSQTALDSDYLHSLITNEELFY